jgi:hypothetical protein
LLFAVVVRLVPSAILAGFLLVPAPDAIAEETGATTAPPGATTVDRSVPRLRLDLAGTFAAGRAKSSRVDTFELGPGLALDLGAQLGDRAAVYARGETSTLFPFTFQAAAYVIGEWTPVRHFSIGSGLGYEMMASYCQGCSPQEPSPRWAGVSFPLILGLNIGPVAPARATRTVLRIGLEGAVGYEASSDTVGWHTTLTVGVAWM